MPRKRFVIAPDAARRRVDCKHYSLNGGAPRCSALTHPWCLAPGEAPGTCAFRVPKEDEEATEKKTGSRRGKKTDGQAD